MRKLKLQMQVSIDGYVAGPAGEMDWMEWNWGADINAYVGVLTEPIDLILLGHNLAKGFIPHWEAAAAQETPEPGAEKFSSTAKVVFSKTLTENPWKNTTVENGDMAEAVQKLKSMEGGDIVAYGGAQFVSSLIEADLIDEYNLLVNPSAIGSGMAIFKGRKAMKLVCTTAFDCGIVAMKYEPIRG